MNPRLKKTGGTDGMTTYIVHDTVYPVRIRTLHHIARARARVQEGATPTQPCVSRASDITGLHYARGGYVHVGRAFAVGRGTQQLVFHPPTSMQ
jgi:hypothetical protein